MCQGHRRSEPGWGAASCSPLLVSILYSTKLGPHIMYSPANTEFQNQLNSQTPQGQSLRASRQSTLFKFASNTLKERPFLPDLGLVDRTRSSIARDNNLEGDASASNVDQPLLPPSKRQRLTPSASSNIINESKATLTQPPRKLAPTYGDSKELQSHARARRHSEPKRERRKRIWYCFYGQKDCPRQYYTTNYDNIRSYLKRRHGQRQATDILPRMLALATAPSKTSFTIADIDKARLNKRLIDYITSSNVPFRTASNKKLHAIINEVLPSASSLLIKSHSTVAKHVKKEHDFYQEQLKALLTTSRSLIHFTCDAWTANYGSHELLSITARLIAPDGKLSKTLLALYKLPSSHASAQCAPLFFETIINYGIKQKVRYITSNNATYKDTMISHLAALFSERLSIDQDPRQH